MAIKKTRPATAKRKFKSEAMKAAHETIVGLHRIGVVDKATMRRFDDRCLTPTVKITAKDVKKIREANNVSQAVFAYHIGVTSTLVSAWERGDRKPTGSARRLLSLAKAKGLKAIA